MCTRSVRVDSFVDEASALHVAAANDQLAIVKLLVTAGDALGPLGSFASDSEPHLHLSDAQLRTIERYELLSRIRCSRDLVRRLPSRGVTGGGQLAVGKLANSSSHKKEYMQFFRMATSKNRFPASLKGEFEKDKLDLFRLWMSSDKDCNKLVLAVERKAG